VNQTPPVCQSCHVKCEHLPGGARKGPSHARAASARQAGEECSTLEGAMCAPYRHCTRGPPRHVRWAWGPTTFQGLGPARAAEHTHIPVGEADMQSQMRAVIAITAHMTVCAQAPPAQTAQQEAGLESSRCAIPRSCSAAPHWCAHIAVLQRQRTSALHDSN
jgi:hypothetical protein